MLELNSFRFTRSYILPPTFPHDQKGDTKMKKLMGSFLKSLTSYFCTNLLHFSGLFQLNVTFRGILDKVLETAQVVTL